MTSRQKKNNTSRRAKGLNKSEEPMSLYDKVKAARDDGILIHLSRVNHTSRHHRNETYEKNDRSRVGSLNSTRTIPQKEETPSDANTNSKPVEHQTGGYDCIPGTPSTCLNISPWENPTPPLSNHSVMENSDKSRIVTPESKLIPDNNVHRFRTPSNNGDQSEDTENNEIAGKNIASWRDNKSLADCNLYMLNNQVDYDVTILLGKSQDAVVAHSFVLSARSAHMEVLLAKQKGKISKLIVIPEVTTDVFKEILKYFYTDETELSTSLALSIIQATCFVGSRDLMLICFKYLMTEISADTVCTYLELAHQFNVKHVYYKCLHFIYSNAEEVLVAKSFRTLCAECVEVIVKSDDLYAEELSVYKALIAWADMQLITKEKVPTDVLRREILGKLLYHVRFVVMDTDEFTQNISKAEVLPQDEKLVLYQTKYQEGTDLPDHFDKQPRKRRTHIQLGLDVDETRKHSTPIDNTDPQRYAFLAIDKVIRFGDLGGTWHMKGPDAVRFTVSSPVILRGVQIFGPNQESDEFKVDIAVMDEDKHRLGKNNVQIDPETDVKVYDVLLDEPLQLKADETYTVELNIKSKPTHSGVNGQDIVVKGNIKFEFKNSNRSFNGTDITVGQIPAILYSIPEN